MANAKKCDICGKYYDVPDREDLLYSEPLNTSMIRVLRLKTEKLSVEHEVMQFDSCESCLQDVLDYILAKRADTEKSEVAN